MSWRAVARKDFRDAVRSRALLALGGFFVLLVGGTAGIVGYTLGGVTASTLFGSRLAALGLLRLSYSGLLGFVVGFVALVAAYESVVGERESGTLKLLLSLPHSRRDVVLGKALGRGTVVLLPVLVGFLVAAVVLFATGGSVDFATYTPLVLLTLLLAAVFVAIAVGVSAAAVSNRQATLAAVGLYVLFSVFWAPVAQGVPTVVSRLGEFVGVGGLSTRASVELGLAVKYVNPLRAYETLVATLYQPELAARLVQAGFRERVIAQQTFDGVPFFLSDAAILAMFCLWAIVPPVYGYLVFEGEDL